MKLIPTNKKLDKCRKELWSFLQIWKIAKDILNSLRDKIDKNKKS